MSADLESVPVPVLTDGSRPTQAAGPVAWARHGVALALWGLTVLALHGIVLAGWPFGAAVDATHASPTLRVRQLALAAPPFPALESTAAPLPPPLQPAPTALRPLPPQRPADAMPDPASGSETAAASSSAFAAAPKAAAGTASIPATAKATATATATATALPPPSNPAEVELTLPLAAAAATTPAATVAPFERVALAADEAPPTYRTKLPPAAVLRYELRRGALSGQGALRWQPGAEGYELTMEGSVLGLQVLAQQSSGGFDAAGLAPLRFVDRRRGRAQQAANFQRERGLITYSTSAAQFPLVPGAQDRVSWMVQLAAIVDAEPARWRAGQHVVMAVTGARGDADVWTFTVAAAESVLLADGTRVPAALALRREPRKPFDTRVEVWLDPARHHLPVRMQLTGARADEALVFLLEP